MLRHADFDTRDLSSLRKGYYGASAMPVEVLRELATLGFDEIYLHHVGREQERFIDAFGEHVLPELRG